MSSGGFNVSTQELRAHSETVDRIAESIGEAATAAGTERAGGLVYGVLFDGLAQPFLNMWADSIQDYIAKNAELGHSIASALASNADTYDGIEQANQQHISASGRGE